jgi:cysteine desulfurase/selenocysteine lyase
MSSSLKLPFELNEVRQRFPALTQKINGHELVYLDSAATTLKPQMVVDRIAQYYSFESANVHRGAHSLSDLATAHFEEARESIQKFIGALASEQIIFTKGTTESFNLIAFSFAKHTLKENDLILLTEMEHHANIVPWQMLATEKKLRVEFVKVLENGELDEADLKSKLSLGPKIFSFTACSNTLGTLLDIEKLTQWGHQAGAVVCVDAAQIISLASLNVEKCNVDFLAFSAHKIFGPTGFGVLYGKKEHLEKMPPYQGGGSMISKVTTKGTTFNEIPFRFEAGTPHIEGALGTKSAIDFFTQYDIQRIHEHEMSLLNAATEALLNIPDVQIYGRAQNKGPILSFNIKGAHHSDVGQILDQMGVAVRAGHHCTQPLMQRLGVTGTVRASFSIYNSMSDVQALCKGILKAREILL